MRWLLLVPVTLSVTLVACMPLDSLARSRILVQWTTGTEIDTAGFNLYRSESPEGPYTQINTVLIAPSTDPVIGGKYEYQDNDVVIGRTYYYQLEDIEYNGTTTRHGPIVATAPWVGLPTHALVGLGVGLAILAGWIFVRRFRRIDRRA